MNARIDGRSLSVDAVLEWLPRAPQSFADELQTWAVDADASGGPARRVVPEDFTAWWARFERLYGAEMPRSVEVDIRLLLGAAALQAGSDSAAQTAESPGVTSTAFRTALVSVGRGPDGFWRTQLLNERVLKALSLKQLSSDLDPEGAVATLRHTLGALLEECDELARVTLSARGKRAAASCASLCSLYLDAPDETCERVERYFLIDPPRVYEAGDDEIQLEPTFVALAGAIACGELGDLEGVSRVMHRIKQQAWDDEELLPERFLPLWVRAVEGRDPLFAEMIARDLLTRLTHANGTSERTDAQFEAAFLLAKMSAATGDFELGDSLANEWMPRAYDAPHGAGSQRWLAALDLGDRTGQDDDYSET